MVLSMVRVATVGMLGQAPHQHFAGSDAHRPWGQRSSPLQLGNRPGEAEAEADALGAETRPLSSAAPLSTVLSSRFGHRLVVMLGGLLVSAGMVTAAFSQKVYHMYIAIGIVSAWSCFFSGCSSPPPAAPNGPLGQKNVQSRKKVM